jgi:hypothetical protein
MPTDPPALDLSHESLAARYLALKRGKPVRKGPPNLAQLTTQLLPTGERSGGVGITQLRARWVEIVGDKIASISQPDLIKGETLVVKVVAAAAPMLSMRQAEIIGLIRLAGAVKVKKLSFVRAPLTKPMSGPTTEQRARQRKRPLNAQEQRLLDEKLTQIKDPELKAALKRLADATSDLD